LPAAAWPGIFTQAVHSRVSGYLPTTSATEGAVHMQLLVCDAAAVHEDRMAVRP
jgi:hypothetical protein